MTCGAGKDKSIKGGVSAECKLRLVLPQKENEKKKKRRDEFDRGDK